MPSLRSWLRLTTALIIASGALAAPASQTKRAAITQVSQSQLDSYTPITHYASAGYCTPSSTLAWNCANCGANPSFKPVASGGDGATVQYCERSGFLGEIEGANVSYEGFVGYDPSLKTVVVSVQGTKPSAIIPVLTDANIELVNLDSSLFPGIDSSIQVHKGFADAHSSSASDILAVVQKALSKYSTSNVLLTGHSLGAAISLLHSVYIPLQIPHAKVTYVGYGLPRVGNQAFADYVDAHDSIASVTHINNKEDPIPIMPGRFLGFHHPSGEIHIQDSGKWVACPGQDNTDSQCTVSDVKNLLDGHESDHDGPYNGVEMKC